MKSLLVFVAIFAIASATSEIIQAEKSERNFDGAFEVNQSQLFRYFVGWVELSSLQLHRNKLSFLPWMGTKVSSFGMSTL